MAALLFYFFSGFTLLSAFFVIFAAKPTHALVALIATMFCLAVLYLLLGAYFVAMVHLIVYAGAVLVLFLFVIMLQGVGAKDISLGGRFPKTLLVAFFSSGTAFLIIFMTVLGRTRPLPGQFVRGNVEAIGLELFHNYLLPFELVSLLLLIGVFAAVALAKRGDA